MAKDETKNYFWAALRHCYDISDFGNHDALAAAAGVTPSTISGLLSRKKAGRTKTQAKIALAFGYEFVDFLVLGRCIITKSEYPSPRVYAEELAEAFVGGRPPIREAGQITERRQHTDDIREGIIALFDNREKARRIILRIAEIEKLDKKCLERFDSYIDGVLDALRT